MNISFEDNLTFDDIIIPGIIGAVVGITGGLLTLLFARRKTCSNCGNLFPRIDLPRSLKQWVTVRRTCRKCGCEVDRRGKKIDVEPSGRREL